MNTFLVMPFTLQKSHTGKVTREKSHGKSTPRIKNLILGVLFPRDYSRWTFPRENQFCTFLYDFTRALHTTREKYAVLLIINIASRTVAKQRFLKLLCRAFVKQKILL